MEQRKFSIFHKKKEIKSKKDYLLQNKEHTIFGEVDILFENSNFGLYRLIIEPGKKIPAHFHLQTKEIEFVIDSGIILNGKIVEHGDNFTWQQKEIHQYNNPLTKKACILCYDEPAFKHSDEIYV